MKAALLPPPAGFWLTLGTWTPRMAWVGQAPESAGAKVVMSGACARHIAASWAQVQDRVLAALFWVAVTGCTRSPLPAADAAAATEDAAQRVADMAVRRADSFELQGPAVFSIPPVLKFAEVTPIGPEQQRTVKLCNRLPVPMAIHAIEVQQPAPGIALHHDAVLPQTLAGSPDPETCAGSLAFGVSMAAGAAWQGVSTAKGSLRVFSNANPIAVAEIAVWVQPVAKKVQFLPLGGLDFGPVEQGVAVTGTVSLLNLTPEPIALDSLQVTGEASTEFLVTAVGGLAPGPNLPPLQTFTSLPVSVQFVPATGTGSAKAELQLQLLQDQPLTLTVPLQGTRTGAPVLDHPNCHPMLVPPVLAFGNLMPGSVATAKATFTNTGKTACHLKAIKALECSSTALPLPGMVATAQCKGKIAAEVTIGPLAAKLFGFAPGGAAQVDVTIKPAPVGGVFGIPSGFALLHATFEDADTGAVQTVPAVDPVNPLALAKASPNLVWTTLASPLLTVLPQPGGKSTAPGRTSPPLAVTVRNNTMGDIAITGQQLVGCSDVFVPLAWPVAGPAGVVVQPKQEQTWLILYEPKVAGPAACTLALTLGQPKTCLPQMASGAQACSAAVPCSGSLVCGTVVQEVPITGFAVAGGE